MTPRTKKFNMNLVGNNIPTSLGVGQGAFVASLQEQLSTRIGLVNATLQSFPFGEHLIAGRTSVTSLDSHSIGVVSPPLDTASVLFQENIVTESLIDRPAYTLADDALQAMYESIVPQQSSILSSTLWNTEALSATKLRVVEEVRLYYGFNFEGLTWKDFLPRITRFVKDVVKNFEKLFEISVYWITQFAKIFFVESTPTVLLA